MLIGQLPHPIKHPQQFSSRHRYHGYEYPAHQGCPKFHGQTRGHPGAQDIAYPHDESDRPRQLLVDRIVTHIRQESGCVHIEKLEGGKNGISIRPLLRRNVP